MEEDLRWAILREQDENEKARLMDELENLRENERRWNEARQLNSHLWGSHEDTTD